MCIVYTHIWYSIHIIHYYVMKWMNKTKNIDENEIPMCYWNDTENSIKSDL